MTVEDVDPLHFLQVGAVLRVTILDQQAVGEGHIVGGNWPTIVEARLFAQVEHHPAAVFAVLHALGNQPIAGAGFVARWVVLAGAGHQRLVQFADAVLHEIGRSRRAASLEAVWVERIEGAIGHDPQRAAFGGVGIHPVKVGEAGGVFEGAELGVAVAFA